MICSSCANQDRDGAKFCGECGTRSRRGRRACGSVAVARTAGKNSEGGAVESIFVRLIVHRGEKVSHMEFFEIEHLDRAVARLEELGS